jgi:hypothetical protein
VLADEQLGVAPTIGGAPAAEAPIDFTCPRCGEPRRERFYGPCAHCRDELRASLGGPQRDEQAEAYEPKLNVTPNAVALKE